MNAGVPTSTSAESPSRPSRTGIVVAALAAIVVAAVAWHASVGISPFDDSHYVAITLRLAQGARPMADEWTLQVLGFALLVPLVKLWTLAFGTTGVALAMRLAYVALATVGWFFGYRALRPSFGSAPAALAVAAPMLVPPFGIFMASYNTMATLGFVLAVCLGFAAVRDASWPEAALAGGALALAGSSYAPLIAASAVLLLVLTWYARRSRQVLVAMWVTALAVTGVFAAWLFASASVEQMSLAVAYSHATWSEMIVPWARIPGLLLQVRRGAVAPQAWPLWALAVVAAVPWPRRRVNAVAAALLPVAAAVPGAWGYATGVFKVFGTTGPAYLLYAVVAMLPGAIVRAIRDRDAETGHLLVMGAAVAVPAVPLVAYSTSAGWYWGLPLVGAAALSVGIVLGWMRVVSDGGLRWLPIAAGGVMLAVLVTTLFAYTFDDGPPFALTSRMRTGPLAGLATSPINAQRLENVQTWARSHVKPADRVLFLGGPLGYLLVGGQMETNAVWLNSGQSDAYTVAYLEAQSHPPDHVFVLDATIAKDGGLTRAEAHDPLIRWIGDNYRPAGGVFEYEHFVPMRSGDGQ